MVFLKERIIVFLVPLFLALPFMNRAYFVDDHYFVQIAQWLVHHPDRPYDFEADDAGPANHGWEKDGFVRMVNPLAHQYYLALLLKVGSSKEWFLRLGCVLLSCFSALFLFELARRFTYHPLWVTLATLATPVFWLTSYSLLIDGTLGFFFFGALYFFIRGLEKDSFFNLMTAGLLMGLSVLTKYPGLFIFPLTGLWWFLRRKKTARFWPVLLSWIWGLTILAVYSGWTAHLYGRPHILAASSRMVQLATIPKLLVLLTFLSGATLIPLLAWLHVPRRITVVGILFVLGLTILFSSSVGGFSFLQGFLFALWPVTSIVFVIAYIGHYKRWERPKDLFLFLWLLGFLGLMTGVMGWVAARYYMIGLPAIVFSTLRLVEMSRPHRGRAWFPAVFLSVFVFSGLLAVADYRQAEPARQIGPILKSAGFSGGERHFFMGDSFTMSYLREEGWVPCFPTTKLAAGDWLLFKEVTMPPTWFPRKHWALKPMGEWNFSGRIPVKVMDMKGAAGFYASVWGALPFTFSLGPYETFHLFEVVGYND